MGFQPMCPPGILPGVSDLFVPCHRTRSRFACTIKDSRQDARGTHGVMRTLVWLKYRFIGDAVMATPLLRAVQKSDPDDLRIYAAKHLVELFGAEPYSGAVEPTGKVKGIGPFFAQIRELRRAQFDRVFLVNRSARSAVIARFAGIRERIGHTTEGRAALLTHKVQYDTKKFEAECYGDLCRAVGLECPDQRVYLTRPNNLGHGRAIGIQPGSTALHKAIRPEHLALLARAIRDQGRPIVLLGGKDERDYGDALLAMTGTEGIEDKIGGCSLRETMDTIASLHQLFCGDTGLVHIACGLDTPSVSVFASTPSTKWGHNYAPHQVIDVGDDQIEKLDPLRLIAAMEARA